MYWNAVSAISAAFSAVVVTIAAAYAYLQVREAGRARSAQVALQHQQWHADERYRRTRRRLLNGEFADLNAINDGDKADLEALVDQFETLGMLVQLGLLDRDVASVFFRYSPTQVFECARPFIDSLQHVAPGYGKYFEAFVPSAYHR